MHKLFLNPDKPFFRYGQSMEKLAYQALRGEVNQ
jgi:hypothetical protein